MANNSCVLERDKISKTEFDSLWKRVEASGSGEPGIYWTNNKDWGTNPCVEIGLRPFQMCNLVEVNVNDLENQEDLNNRVTVASFFGTLQAGFTDFHYLRPIWKQTTDRDALLGVSMTGIASGKVLKLDLSQAAFIAKKTNELLAETIGINISARITCVKPAGTTSLVLGTSSGIHAWHNDYYLRTMRFAKNENIATYLQIYHPELCEDDVLRPKDTLCVRIPVKAPEGSIFRTETAIDTLERVKKFAIEWIKPGHNKGDNSHNVSATISIDKNRMYPRSLKMSDYIKINEWEAVGEWMWKNKEHYNGLSVLDYFGGSYAQMPFSDISEEEYNKRVKNLKSLDLSKVIETDDTVNFSLVPACSGGSCEIE